MTTTDVAIIGAGPAGLVLAHLLAARGIDSVVLESDDRDDYVEHRVRAGVLEHPSVALLRELGVADRLDRDGLAHRGIELAFDGRRHRLDFNELVGHSITVYGRREIVKDLIAARLAAGDPIVFEAAEATIDEIDDTPVVRYLANGENHELRCRVVAGCDGFHGVSRDRPQQRSRAARGVRSRLSVRMARHPRRSGADNRRVDLRQPRQRLRPVQHALAEGHPAVLQVPADERIEDWSDDRIWSELDTRLPTGDGFSFNTGPILERGITAMRSFVFTPMRSGSLVIAGDAAHIVPPTGAKGMNLAIADVAVLADILDDVITRDHADRLAEYTSACLQRVWRCQHFSWWMTSMLHRFDDDPFRRQLQLSEFRHVTSSTAAATGLAENYVGLALGASFVRSGSTLSETVETFRLTRTHRSISRLSIDASTPPQPSAAPPRHRASSIVAS